MKQATLLVLIATSSAALADSVRYQFEFNNNFNPSVGPSLTLGNPGQIMLTTHPGLPGAQVAKFTDSLGAPSEDPYITLPNVIGGNGGGARTNRYTVIMDLYLEIGSFHSLLQTGSSHIATGAIDTGPNQNDGDWFIRGDGGMGISSNYTDPGNPLLFTNGWHRIALVIDTTSPIGETCLYRSYVDGALQNIVQTPSSWGLDGRFSLGTNFHLFADEDSEVRPEWFINSLQIRDYAMTDAEIAALGGPTAAGIPVAHNASLTGISVQQGSLLGGNLASISASDDLRYLVLCDEFESTGEVRITASSPISTPNQINGLFETRAGRTDLSQFTKLFNFGSNTWDQIDFRNTTLTDVIYTTTSPGANHVSGAGEIRIQMLWIPQGDIDAADGWSMGIDHVSITVQ